MVYTSILPTKKLEKKKESESRCVDDDTGQTPSSSACNLSHRGILSATSTAIRVSSSTILTGTVRTQPRKIHPNARQLIDFTVARFISNYFLVTARAKTKRTTSRNDTDTSCRACNTHGGADRDAICAQILATYRIRMSEEAYIEKPARQ